ncbi:hypothetical protein [Nonomuraea candida]|uniref:hypothetical protein n=1 Tax=Nonomuraea candida TaxID=359159 RepID=UPI0005BADAB7|nr:hypothetical protein [Nonomuraea candida]
MAALTAGVSWLFASSSTAETCSDLDPGLLTPALQTSYCDTPGELRLSDNTGGSRMIAEEANRLAMEAGRLARQLGLTGLATVKDVMGMADLGGVAATWHMPSLTAASPAVLPMLPAPVGMADLNTMSAMPMLPTLPALPILPQTPRLPQPRYESAEPGKSAADRPPYEGNIAGHGIGSPLDVQQPVQEIGEKVLSELLPKVAEAVKGSSVLPGGEAMGGGGLGGGLLPDLGLD